MVWSPHVPSFIGKSERCEGFWLVPLCGYSVMLSLHFTLEFLLGPETLYRCVFQWFWNILLTEGKGSNLEYEKKIPKVGRIGGGRAELRLWLSWCGHMNLTALKIQLFLWMRTEVPSLGSPDLKHSYGVLNNEATSSQPWTQLSGQKHWRVSLGFAKLSLKPALTEEMWPSPSTSVRRAFSCSLLLLLLPFPSLPNHSFPLPFSKWLLVPTVGILWWDVTLWDFVQ